MSIQLYIDNYNFIKCVREEFSNFQNFQYIFVTSEVAQQG